MPELPEVETVVRQLGPLISGQTVGTLRVLDVARLDLARPGRLRGRRLAEVRRVGKWIVLVAESPPREPLYLAVHLRMTGRLIWHPGQRPASQRHLRAWLNLTSGSRSLGGRLLFYDPRRFGEVRLLETTEPITPAGLDPVQRRLRPARLGALIGASRQPLKAWLLRQDRLVGIGNIYASEILYRARLHPERPAGTLTDDELRRLQRAIGSVLRAAIRHCGTTFSDFQGAQGLTGSYQHYLAVYGKEGEPCPSCGEPIERLVQQQRSTFLCPRCQANDNA